MWSSAHLPLCNRPNRVWLIVIYNCQINSHRSRVQLPRLHVNFRVVCKISYRWGRLSAWCLHMRVFVFLEGILTRMGVTMLFIPLNEVVWSNSCDQFVPGLHIRHAGHGQCMLAWFASLRPSASSEMSHGATSWRSLFWFHTCMFYFVRRWLRVKIRGTVWIRIIFVLSWRTMFSIVLHDRKRSTKGFVFIYFDISVDVCVGVVPY